MFASAKQAEIIRSNQKDDYYSSYIKSSLADIVQRFLGPRSWIRWRQELDVLADIGYFGLTTFVGFQTLGEEYVNIVQVDDSLRAIPGKMTRGAMILLQIVAPYIIERCLTKLETYLRLHPDSSLRPEARVALLDAIPVIRHIVTLLHRCHLALFYMRGVFYHIAKRMTATHYLLVRDPGGEGAVSNYRILGWLSITQLVFTFLQHLYKWSIKRKIQNKGAVDIAMTGGQDYAVSSRPSDSITRPIGTSEVSADPSLKCVLCLESRINTTCTPCGHLFCWTCITEWCSNKAECPLCREAFQMSRLVCLQNYDPS